MRNNRSITNRYIGLFLLGCFLFSYPVLTLCNQEKTVLGVPLFFIYLFLAWSVLIVCILLCGKGPKPILPSEPNSVENNLKQSG